MGRVMLCLAALALTPCAVQAQVYKCVDPAGKVVYTQDPCPKGARSSALSRDPAPAPKESREAASGQKSATTPEEAFRKRRQEQAEAEKKSSQQQAQTQDKQENCRAARGQLTSLESGIRQVRINENGERYFLDDDQIEQEKARARKAVESSCGG
jgi:hypothetical protein